MVMVLPRRSTSGTRPAYLDNLFRDTAPPLPSPSLHSASSSISTNSSSALDLRLNKPLPRPLSPAFEEDDGGSIRSLRLNLSPRFRVRNIFNRRTYPEAKETTSLPSSRTATPSHSHPGSRRPSLPKLQTTFTSPPRRQILEKEKPLPIAPTPSAQELSCHRCYYYAARHCSGWVMGGSHGDACEQCLQAGFFGAP